ncbi:MAG: Fur family transcriptional regulator [Opitutales bacterium]
MQRNTRQRQAIFDVLLEHGRPLSRKELHAKGREKIPRLGLATVYRALDDMEKEGQIVKLDYPGQPLRFELPTFAHHPHFLCSSCRRVFNLKPQKLTNFPKLDPGFQATGSETIVYGTCPDCRR